MADTADFENNVTAIAVTLVFAKLVTHRLRLSNHAAGPWREKIMEGIAAALHSGAVLFGIVTVGLALYSTAQADPPNLRTAECVALIISAACVLGDTVLFDVARGTGRGDPGDGGRPLPRQ
jgi:hypothetical protein